MPQSSGIIDAMVRATSDPSPDETSLEFDGDHFGLKITFDDEAAAAVVASKQAAVQALVEKFASDLEGLLA